MSAVDQLLADIDDALADRFADPVVVHGITMSRAIAKAMERGLLRERKAKPEPVQC